VKKRTISPYPHMNWMPDRQGNLRGVLRVPGSKAVTIKGQWRSPEHAYGSPEFAMAYREAMEGHEPLPKKGLPAGMTGTLNALRRKLYLHKLFTSKKPSTQRSIRSYIDTVCEHCGDLSVAHMTREDVQDIVDIRMEGKPSGARNLLIALRLAMRVAVAEGWRKKGDDPCAEIDLPEITGDGYRTWTDDEAAAYEAGYAVGTAERFVYEMYAWTALRGSDAARMGRRNLVKRKKPL
jgi:hypothetical protein